MGLGGKELRTSWTVNAVLPPKIMSGQFGRRDVDCSLLSSTSGSRAPLMSLIYTVHQRPSLQRRERWRLLTLSRIASQ